MPSRIGGRGTSTGKGTNRKPQKMLAANQRRQASDRARLRQPAPVFRHPSRGGVARG